MVASGVKVLRTVMRGSATRPRKSVRRKALDSKYPLLSLIACTTLTIKTEIGQRYEAQIGRGCPGRSGGFSSVRFLFFGTDASLLHQQRSRPFLWVSTLEVKQSQVGLSLRTSG